jgi:hypothetical protein
MLLNFKKMRHSAKYIIALALLLSGISCEKNIDIDIDEITPMIVLNGLIESDSSVSISLSRTRHILDNKEVSTLKNGTVELFDTHGNSANLVWNSQGRYETDNFQIAPGEEYRITAKAEGYYDVEATCVIPEKIEIKRLDTLSVYDEWNEEALSLGIVFEDDPNEDNYYQLSLMAKYYQLQVDYIQRYDTLYVDIIKDTVIMGFVMDTIETSIPYYENVWFQTEDLIIEEWDNSGGVVFSDRLIQGKEYSMRGTIYTGYRMWSADTSSIYINLHSITKDYYDYLTSYQKHIYAKDDPFATPVVVRGNVENGLGIFGGRATSKDSIQLAPSQWEDPYWKYK